MGEIKIEHNSLQVIAKEYLEELGVGVNTDLSLFEIDKSGYMKISRDIVERVDSAMQQIPYFVNLLANTGDVYRVLYDKGLGVLQKSAQHSGQLLGNVVSPDANNKIRDVARLQKLAVGPQIANGIFSVMSMVTGQYFMTQINNNLSQIELSVASIQQYLEYDKKSKLQSEEDFLKMTQKTLPFIIENKAQQQSTITSIQKIKMNSLANIKFYRMQISDFKNISEKKDKAEEVIENVKNISCLISEYWYSLYLFCFATCLEPMVAQNYSKDYLSILMDDMKDRCDCYKDDYKTWKKKLNGYIESAKAFEDNKIYDIMKTVAKNKIYANLYIAAGQLIVGAAADVADKVDKKAKKKKKEAAIGSLEYSDIGKNVDVIEVKRKELLLFGALYNNKIELVKDHEDIYIKLSE